MTPERYKEVGQLYRAVLELAPEQRAAFLAEACGGDEALRQEVESLLGYEAQREGLIDQPALEVAARAMAAEPPPSLVSQQVAHYQILSLLGRGGMGEVYLARDTQLERPVALKVLPARFTQDAERLQRFVREAKAASALNHPNIITIYEIGKVGETHFMATEFIEGETLRQRMAGEQPSLGEALAIAMQVAAALAAAHKAGIVHRDIKPENVMVRPDGLVKVLDFGLAKLTEAQAPAIDTQASTVAGSSTEAGVVMGTPRYMSPEQARGQKVDHRTDIFSLGVMLYEMVTGRRPFEGATASDVMVAILQSEPPPVSQVKPGLPPELEHIVSRMLEKEREARYRSAAELRAEFERLQRKVEAAAEEKASLGEAPAVLAGEQRKGRLITRHGWQGAAIGLVVLVLAAIIYARFFRGSPVVPAAEIKSLAVLPLKNIGGDAQDEYLSDGITDELITKLTRLRMVRVVSLPVVMRFKNSAKDAAEIGRELGVEAVLYGTMRKAGSRFRVSAHLVNVKDGFELWADNDFEHELRDLLDAGRQLAEAVAAELKGQLTTQERAAVAKKSTANVEAYEFLLRGKEHYLRGGSASQPVGGANEQKLARQMFEQAIKLDSNFADAYAWLALILYYQFHDGQGSRAVLGEAINKANRALELDPNLVIARRALIHIYHSTGQTEEGLRQAKRVLENDPDDFDAVAAAALAYFRAGMLERAIPFYQKAVSLDPLDPVIRSEYARCYLHTGEYQKGLDVLLPILAQDQNGQWVAMQLYARLSQFDKTIEMAKRAVEKYPNSIGNWSVLVGTYVASGQIDQARTAWLGGAQLFEARVAAVENERTRINMGLIYARLGERDKALQHAQRAVSLHSDDPWVLYQTCLINAWLGRRREALDYFKQALAHDFLSVHYVAHDQRPNLALYNLRDDPEFKALYAQLQKKVEELKARY
jgi:TolB-like protein/Flp pilus assembly protein TadD